jgi:hypothetical protein
MARESLAVWTMYVKRKYGGREGAFQAAKISFGNRVLTMISVWLEA